MKNQLINKLENLNFENMDMYFFYIKNTVKDDENIGMEIIGQVQVFIDELEEIKKHLIELGYRK